MRKKTIVDIVITGHPNWITSKPMIINIARKIKETGPAINQEIEVAEKDLINDSQ